MFDVATLSEVQQPQVPPYHRRVIPTLVVINSDPVKESSRQKKRSFQTEEVCAAVSRALLTSVPAPSLNAAPLLRAQINMLEVTKGSFLFKVPAFAMGFYAFNQWLLSTGLMVPFYGLMFGTSDEMMPLMTSELAQAFWLANAFSLTALCYLFLPSTGLDPKIVFQGFFIVQLPWIPLLGYMYTTGLMGIPGIAQFGSFSITVTCLSIYTYLKL